jgi:hypothetical protein
VGLWWTKRHWVRFSPSTFVSPASHSTNFSTIIITRDWHNRPISGRSAKWTQLDSTPQYTNLNLKINSDMLKVATVVQQTMTELSEAVSEKDKIMVITKMVRNLMKKKGLLAFICCSKS